MTTTVGTITPTRTPANPTRKTALVAGVFYVLTFAASIPALFLLGPVLHHPDYIVSAGSNTSVLLGCSLDVVTALTGIGSAVALFSVVKRQHEGLAGFERGGEIVVANRKRRVARRPRGHLRLRHSKIWIL